MAEYNAMELMISVASRELENGATVGVMDFEPNSKRMRVISLHPGYTFSDVQENCGFELLKADELGDTMPPSEDELRILREEVDPYRYVIGRN